MADIPTTYRYSTAADTLLLPWSEFFKDPLLVKLIEKALEKNSDIVVSLKSVEQLERTLQQAKLSLLPTLDLTSTGSRSWLSRGNLSATESAAIGVNLSWEADIWGKSRLLKEDARAQFFAQKENHQALRTRIISQVAQAYYTLLGLDEQKAIAKRNVDLSDSTLAIAKLQYSSGLVTSLAVDQAEAQKKSAELTLPQIRQSIALQETLLSILCGSFPDTIARRGKLEDLRLPDSVGIGVPAMLISRRPDVKAAEQAVISASAKAGLAKVAMYPTFSLTSQIGTNATELSRWFDLPGSVTKSVALNLAAPIFQKKALRTSYQNALLERDKAAEQFKKSVMTAVGEVTDAMAKIESSNERITLLQQKNSTLESATSNAVKLYKSGMATYLEVITANNSKLQNDLELISGRMERVAAIVELYRALGGGIK